MADIKSKDIRPLSFRCTVEDVEEVVFGHVLAETPDHYFVLVIDDHLPDGLSILSRSAFELAGDAASDSFFAEVMRANYPDKLPLGLTAPVPTTLAEAIAGLAQRGDVFGVEWMGEDYRVVRILAQSAEGWHLEEIHSDGSLDEWDVADLTVFDVLHIDQRYERGIQRWLTAKGLPLLS